MNRIVLAFSTSLWGGAVMATLSDQISGTLDLDLIGAAAAGAFVAGLVLADLFLRPWHWMLIVAPLATTVGAALASSALILPAGHDPLWQALLLGPAFVWSAIFHDPLTLMVWLLGASLVWVLGAHLTGQPRA